MVGLYILIIIELLKLKLLGITNKNEKIFLISIIVIIYLINDIFL